MTQPINKYHITRLKSAFTTLALATAGMFAACNGPQKPAQQTPPPKPDTTVTKPAQPVAANQNAITLPVLDALFYEPDFAKSLHSKLGLTAVQIQKLKTAAHLSVADLSEGGAADTASARAATQRYQAQIKTIIGNDKAQQLQQLVNDRYSQGVEGLAPTKPNFVPTDTRIVVNAPAFRMDVFQDGKLLKSYRVGIGYPEFPLPTGMRRADSIIFNPSWTPPDEPWVKGKFSPGRRVSAANEDNPLGIIKIPIGMPSLIHGGKPSSKIGNFASHGCVGLTNTGVQDFTAMLAQVGGATLTADSIHLLGKHRAKTHLMKLPKPVPIDLRYETIVVVDGNLHVYRDVYERGTNTLENAKRVLSAYGVDYDKLTEPEKADLNEALEEMNRDARGNVIASDTLASSQAGAVSGTEARAKKGRVTRRVKGEIDAAVPIAALQGKGYPAPVGEDVVPAGRKGK